MCQPPALAMATRTWIVCGALLTLAGALVAAMSVGALDQEPVRPPPSRRSLVTHSTWQALQGNFVVFRTPSEQVPQQARRLIMAITQRSSRSLYWAKAQHVQVAETELWLVPGPDVTCVAEAHQAGAFGCEVTSAFIGHGLTLGTFEMRSKARAQPQEFRIVGLVPDWAVVATVREGAVRRALQVRHGVFVDQGKQPIVLEQLESKRSRP